MWLAAVVACGDRETTKPPPPPQQPAPTPRACAEPSLCEGDSVVDCATGKLVRACPDGCSHGACADACAAQGVELIYLVDRASELRAFDPSKLPDDPFRVVGKLACEPDHVPFSMAVDRRGIAWVLYDDGKLFRVSILDAHCTLAGAPDHAPLTFGMGFSTDGPGKDDKLYVAGDDADHVLATLDPGSLRWSAIGKIPVPGRRSPELTGTGDGKLFAFVADPAPGFVQEVDRASGKLVGRRDNLRGEAGTPEAWAFAHYGGVFYIFSTVGGNPSLHAVKRKTGAYSLVRDHLPFEVVGAGVSTCAPELERP